MSKFSNYEKMSITKLEKTLAELKETLEDIEDERLAVLGQTGFHLPASAVSRYEAELKGTRERIMAIEEILQKNIKQP